VSSSQCNSQIRAALQEGADSCHTARSTAAIYCQCQRALERRPDECSAVNVLLEDGAANCDVESVGFMTLGLHHRRFLDPTICNPSSNRQPPVQCVATESRQRFMFKINSEARSRGKIHVDVMCCVDVTAVYWYCSLFLAQEPASDAFL